MTITIHSENGKLTVDYSQYQQRERELLAELDAMRQARDFHGANSAERMKQVEQLQAELADCKAKGEGMTEAEQDRLDQIRQVQEEIKHIQGVADHALVRRHLEMLPRRGGEDSGRIVYWVRVACANQRILARLESALAELTQGMRITATASPRGARND